ncbi:zinc finger protein with KRAB and SCAN domains 7-like [Elgaria multicarinata webbii]|uniref:zinc finger protein with KRAB and SCAN domains 7-like n=1 Tax=Elgaria multicarinata webbii TaxID=159646 RepID=UPI002FCD584D
MQDGKGEPSKRMQELWETQWQEFLKRLQPLHTGWRNQVKLETAPWEDAKAFLASFEQVAEACRWPRGEWAARLLPALSEEAEEAFGSLEARDQEDYGKVKAAILRGEALRMEAQRQHFRQFCCQEVRDPRRIHSQVQELCRQWLKPERHSKEQILELLILEQFLASLPVDLQGWIRAGGPDTCSQALALAEDFLMSQKEAEGEKLQFQVPAKEESMDSLDAEEETPEAAKGQIYKESQKNGNAESNELGSGIKYPNDFSSSLPPEGQEMVPTGVKEEPIDLNEASLSLQMVKQSLTQPGQQTIIWQVLHENGGNDHSLGDEKGSQVKMENSQCGGNEPEDTLRTAQSISQTNVLETTEMDEEGSVFKDGQEKQPVGRENLCHELPEGLTAAIIQPSEVNTRDNTPRFSKYGRRYHYRVELDIDSRENQDRCPMSEENLQQNACFDEHQRMLKGENESEFSELHNGSSLDREQNDLTEVKPNNSSECGNSCSYTESLNGSDGFQSEGRPCECSHCGKCVSLPEQCMNHQQLHVGEKKHVCLVCGKIFPFKTGLVRHQGIHTGRKPYQCSQCGRCFRQSEHLKEHERIHTGEKPYRCLECGKDFSRRGNLVCHQRIHTGEKPYKCFQCGKCYNYPKDLRNHQRIHI